MMWAVVVVCYTIIGIAVLMVGDYLVAQQEKELEDEDAGEPSFIGAISIVMMWPMLVFVIVSDWALTKWRNRG